MKVKPDFIIMETVASSVSLEPESVSGSTRAMTCCECTELSFDEIIRRMRERGLSFEEICERTGCGRLCTACLPDLRARACKTR